MRCWRTTLLWSVGLLVAACAAPGPDAQVDIAAEQEAIRTIAGHWLELARAGDAAGIAELFTVDGVMVRENQDPVVGTEAIRQLLASDFAANPSATADFGPEQIDISGAGDMAVEYGRWHDTNLGADGTGEDSGRYMTLYRKINGEWRVTLDFAMSTAPEQG